MNAVDRDVLAAPAGFRSREAGLYMAQLEDQSRRLTRDTRGLSAEALAWQPAPGLNTIGMLLAHIAVVEVYWTQVGPLGLTEFESESVIGIGIDADGLPLAEGGAPPAPLQGRDLAYFDDLLVRARAYSTRAIAALTDADLDREIVRVGRQGKTRHECSIRWILYHMVEHLAGHYGQINLLAHQFRLQGRRG